MKKTFAVVCLVFMFCGFKCAAIALTWADDQSKDAIFDNCDIGADDQSKDVNFNNCDISALSRQYDEIERFQHRIKDSVFVGEIEEEKKATLAQMVEMCLKRWSQTRADIKKEKHEDVMQAEEENRR
jgi:hypothetical protein